MGERQDISFQDAACFLSLPIIITIINSKFGKCCISNFFSFSHPILTLKLLHGFPWLVVCNIWSPQIKWRHNLSALHFILETSENVFFLYLALSVFCICICTSCSPSPMLSGAMIIGWAPYVGDFYSEFRNRGIKGGPLLACVVQKFIRPFSIISIIIGVTRDSYFVSGSQK